MYLLSHVKTKVHGQLLMGHGPQASINRRDISMAESHL